MWVFEGAEKLEVVQEVESDDAVSCDSVLVSMMIVKGGHKGYLIIYHTIELRPGADPLIGLHWWPRP